MTGVYVAVFYLPESDRLSIGRLGRFTFDAGFYAYVGSAQTNLSSRLARHGRKRKPLRWHIDFLSCHATMLGALTYDHEKSMECQIADALAQEYVMPVPGFGSSDCGCKSHLFFLPRDAALL
jgi:sugar fermentation stimulation protein A